MAPTKWHILPPLSRPRCLACAAACCNCPQRHDRNSQQSRCGRASGDRINGVDPIEQGTERRRRSGMQMFNYCGCLYVPAAGNGSALEKGLVKPRPPPLVNVDPPPPRPPEEANLVEKAASMEGSATTTASRAASLERFECDSWSSSAILDGDEEVAAQSYFDLPLELIKSSRQSATHLPVTAAFVFERDRKAALKKLSAEAASDLHVKFSTSPGSCPPSPSSASISPTMQKAIEEFHAFLEARSA
ncbi:uncharacterized protein LOC141823332 [Curcuma longa]|uniref:uncharacterized protein LOC141823332 n=1 Tax=Curcuma longa TaxID=136217 RepID=UPI003D9F35D1